jgi:hypothetical protein
MDQHEVMQARAGGELLEAVLTPASDANGWVLLFTRRDGGQEMLTSAGGHEHVFHDLNHATILATELGFAEVRVEERF